LIIDKLIEENKGLPIFLIFKDGRIASVLYYKANGSESAKKDYVTIIGGKVCTGKEMILEAMLDSINQSNFCNKTYDEVDHILEKEFKSLIERKFIKEAILIFSNK